jgi:O-antigen ligase
MSASVARPPGFRLTMWLFLSVVFVVTFEQVHWNVAGSINLADILALGFLGMFALERFATRDYKLVRSSAAVVGFLFAFLVVYLLGFFNLTTNQGESQFSKGIVKFVIHFCFLVAGTTYLARRSERFFWQVLGIFCAGVVINGVYGIAQLLAARSGFNLDNVLLNPLTGGASKINIYGRFETTQAIYRPQALTGDPNHLGIMIDIPLLILAPIYLRLEKDHPWRRRLGIIITFLILVEIATLSRSGIAGAIAGAAILAAVYRRKLRTNTALAPLAAAVAVLAVIVATRLSYFIKIFQTRVQTGGSSTSAHFAVYGFIPKVLRSNPLLGLGFNNFSVYYEKVTGKTNWGPHSFYVSLIVETGLVGTILFACFLWYMWTRLHRARRLGGLLAENGDAAATRVRPLAWGMTAAFIATLVANIFYLTMTFYYFYVFLMIVLATPLVFARRFRLSNPSHTPGSVRALA